MDKVFSYDLFVSYSTHNRELAEYIVSRIEARGARCFIAPRDLATGMEYASEIVRGIDSSWAVLLIFSSDSDRSAYVLREINSAVSRNKTIIPLRIENFLPSGAMEFYLGPTHWLDAFPEVLDVHLEQILSIVEGLRARYVPQERSAVRVAGPEVLDIPDAIARLGITYRQISMRAIELDFLIVSPGRETQESEIEQTYEEWKGITDYSDAGGVLVEQDEMIGYCDFYPLGEEAYAQLMCGEVLVQPDMIELYELGGTFCGYIAMMAVDPALVSQERFLLLFDWMVGRISAPSGEISQAIRVCLRGQERRRRQAVRNEHAPARRKRGVLPPLCGRAGTCPRRMSAGGAVVFAGKRQNRSQTQHLVEGRMRGVLFLRPKGVFR